MLPPLNQRFLPTLGYQTRVKLVSMASYLEPSPMDFCLILVMLKMIVATAKQVKTSIEVSWVNKMPNLGHSDRFQKQTNFLSRLWPFSQPFQPDLAVGTHDEWKRCNDQWIPNECTISFTISMNIHGKQPWKSSRNVVTTQVCLQTASAPYLPSNQIPIQYPHIWNPRSHILEFLVLAPKCSPSFGLLSLYMNVVRVSKVLSRE